MTALITLLMAGSNTGPFDLYSMNTNGVLSTTPFATNVPKSALVAGYTTPVLPSNTMKVRVVSKSQNCSNYIDIKLV